MKKFLTLVSAMLLLVCSVLSVAPVSATEENTGWIFSDGVSVNKEAGTFSAANGHYAVRTEKVDFTAADLDFSVEIKPGFQKANAQVLCLFFTKDLPTASPANGENVYQVQFYRTADEVAKFALNATWLGSDAAVMAYGGPYADWSDDVSYTIQFKRVDGVIYMYINDTLVYGNAGNTAQNVSNFLTGLGSAYFTVSTVSLDGGFASEVVKVNGETPLPIESSDENPEETPDTAWIFSKGVSVNKEAGTFSAAHGQYAVRTEKVDFTAADLDFSVEIKPGLRDVNTDMFSLFFTKDQPTEYPMTGENTFMVRFYRDAGSNGVNKFAINATWIGSGEALLAYAGNYEDWSDDATHTIRFKRVDGLVNMYINNALVYGRAADMAQKVNDFLTGLGSAYFTIAATGGDGVATELLKLNGKTPLKPVTATALELVTEPGKTLYTVGDDLSVDGGVVKLVYSDGTEETIALTADMVSGYDKDDVGQQTLTVTYKGHTTTFTVTVNPESTESVATITLKADTLKGQYQYSKLDVSGALLIVTFGDGIQKEVPLTADMVSGYNKDVVGQQTLTVTYEGKTATFTVEVLPPDLSRYNFDTYSIPFWEGNTVYLESVYPMTTPDGANEVLQLLYAIDEIIEVRSSDLKTVYEQGKDYLVEDGKLVIPEGSAIPVNPYDQYYFTEKPSSGFTDLTNGGYTAFFEDATLHKRQIAVTYTHKDVWEGTLPTNQGALLPGLQEAINNKGSLDVLFYGDSITVGGNSTKLLNAAPFAPTWAEMFTEYLESLGVTVNYKNTAVGGRDSSWGLSEVQERVVANKPDLLVLAFGMNELGSFGHNNPERYKSNLLSIIDELRKVNPDAEIILVGSMQANSEVSVVGGSRNLMTTKLYEIQEELDGVAVADVTQLHDYLLTRKNYRDMTGNNVNHVNDFLARVYLQALIDTIVVGEENGEEDNDPTDGDETTTTTKDDTTTTTTKDDTTTTTTTNGDESPDTGVVGMASAFAAVALAAVTGGVLALKKRK